MTVENSVLKSAIQDRVQLLNGTVFFFENFFVTEMDEGSNVDFSNSQDLITAVADHFMDGRPYGMICNRINSFSINLMDAEKFNQVSNGMVAKAVVTYSENAEKALEIENHFCMFPNKKEFKSVLEAEAWMEQQVAFFKTLDSKPILNRSHLV